MKFIELEQRTPEWHAWRKAGITATEAAVILGLSPYQTPWRLWSEKTGKALPPKLDDNPFVRFGLENEIVARQLFEVAHDEVVLPACGECDDDPLFRASFDGLTADNEPVEFKCPGTRTLEEVRTLREESAAYKLYYVQVQHQLLVSGAKAGWLVFLDSTSNSLIEFRIQRDEALLTRILAAGREFWEKYVVPKKEPPKDPARDIFVPKGDEETARWIRLATDFRNAAVQAADLQKQLNELKNVCTNCKEELAAMMGDYRYADFGGVTLTKRVTKGTLDSRKLLATGKLSQAEIDACRSTPSESWLIRPTDTLQPKDFVEDEQTKALAEAEATEAMWY